MKSKLAKLLSAILGLSIIFILGLLIYMTIKYFVVAFSDLDPNVAAAIVAAFATIFAATFTLILSRYFETRRIIQKDQREKKIPVYENLINFFFDGILRARSGKVRSQQEMDKFMTEFLHQFTVWGSDDVFIAFRDFRKMGASAQTDEEKFELIYGFARLIMVIRKDLGYKNKGIGEADILRLFINDFDKVEKAKKLE